MCCCFFAADKYLQCTRTYSTGMNVLVMHVTRHNVHDWKLECVEIETWNKIQLLLGYSVTQNILESQTQRVSLGRYDLK